MKIETSGIENDIPLGTARRAFDGVSFSPEKRGDRVVADYVEELKQLAAHIEGYAKDERQQEAAQQIFDLLREKFRGKYMAWIAAQSRCISSMITGGSNFPVRRAEKANASEHNRAGELIFFAKAMRRYAEKSLDRVIPKMEKQESELETMKAKVAQAERYQDFMKATNAASRKKNESDLEKLFADYYGGNGASMLAHFRNANYMGRIGFETWQLSNNLANIKRMKERVSILEAKTEKAASGVDEVREFNGMRVIKNYQEDRLQLVFDGKPEENVRAVLKSSGFKWSPRNCAWQRQLTPNAFWSLNHCVLKSAVMAQYVEGV